VIPLPPRQPTGYTTAHHNGSAGFKNPWPSYQGSSVPTLLKARWSIPKNFVPVPADRLGLVEVRKPDFAAQPDGLKATWIGHASFLIETSRQKGKERGMRILLDPVWSERVGPFGMVGPVRFTPPPCTLDELPEVDAVCISHDHYDHLDSDTLVPAAPHGISTAPFGVAGRSRSLVKRASDYSLLVTRATAMLHLMRSTRTTMLLILPVQHSRRLVSYMGPST
jgi:hypothetical protein